VSEVVTTVFDNLGNNGYQTGVSLLVATVAVVAMLNHKVNIWIIVTVGVGAFWAGWLGYNTVTAQNNPLFPGDVSSTKLWDVAFAGDNGFLLVAGVACVAAIFLWKSGLALAGRLWLLLGAVLGASFIYNLVEAVRVA
jgi:heme/copper-type cytochrome/quinol oxidase subunit 3